MLAALSLKQAIELGDECMLIVTDLFDTFPVVVH